MFIFSYICFVWTFMRLEVNSYSLISTNDSIGSSAFEGMNQCPVSSQLNPNINGILSYPIDLFDVKTYQIIMNHKNSIELNQLFNCTSSEDFSHEKNKIYQVFRFCSIKTTCPVHMSNVIDAMSRTQTWLYQHSLCQIHKNFHNPLSKSRVIILGGSVTVGSASEGCCCSFELDKKCKLFHSKICNKLHMCTWHRYLMKWMQTISLGSVEYINLAQGGCTSPYMAENILSYLKNENIESLSSDDIVFIDHSVNDGMVFVSELKQSQLYIGLEQLIQKLLYISQPNSWPTIILLSQWPFINQINNLDNAPRSDDDPSNIMDYYYTYIKIAKKYHIPLFSYRDVIWSRYALHSSTMKSYLANLQFLHNPKFGYQHPPFFVHLFYADLIASVLLKEISDSCISKNPLRSRSREDMNITKYLETSSTRVEFCDKKLSPLLFMKASPEFDHMRIGSYSSDPPTSWFVVEDSPAKFGWIDEDNEENRQHCVVQSNITKGSLHKKSYSSSLVFEFDLTSSRDMHSKIYLLHIDYLRTYENAGMVDVFLCGRYLTTLDALWSDFESYRFSFNVDYSFEYDPFLYIDDSPYCNENEYSPIIELKRWCHATNSIHEDHKDLEIKARQFQKFKVDSIKLCPATMQFDR